MSKSANCVRLDRRRRATSTGETDLIINEVSGEWSSGHGGSLQTCEKARKDASVSRGAVKQRSHGKRQEERTKS